MHTTHKRFRAALLCGLALGLLAGPATASGGTPFNFTILHTSYVDGRVEPNADGGGGFARFKTLFDQVRSQNSVNATLVINPYNFLGTETFFQVFRATSKLTNYTNEVGFDFLGMGAGELFYGPDTLNNFLTNCTATMVATNIDVKASHALASRIKSSVTKSVFIGGVERKIGIVGRAEESICSRATCGLVVVTKEAIGAISSAVAALRASGVDLVIMHSSAGISADTTLAAAVNGIDVIISNDMSMSNTIAGAAGPYPRTVLSPSGKPVIIVSTFETTSYIGQLRIQVNPSTGTVTFLEGDSRFLAPCANDTAPTSNCTAQNTAIAASIAADSLTIASQLDIVIGWNTNTLPGDTHMMCRDGECALGNLVADAMRWQMNGACDIAFVNGGSIRAPLQAGNVTQRLINQVIPFANTISTFILQGSVLLDTFQYSTALIGRNPAPSGTGRFFQVSGMKSIINTANPDGAKLVRLQVQNRFKQFEDVNPNQLYYCCTNDFERRGGDGYTMLLNKAAQVDDNGPPLVSAIQAYIMQYTPVAFALEGRISIVNQTNTPPVVGTTCQYAQTLSAESGSFVDFCSFSNATRTATSVTLTLALPSTKRSFKLNLSGITLSGADLLTVRAANASTPLQYFVDGEYQPASFTAVSGLPSFDLTFISNSAQIQFVSSSAISDAHGLAMNYVSSPFCPDGFVLGSGSQCSPCGLGTYSIAGDTDCTACLPGYISTTLGSKNCTVCPNGFYQPESAQFRCLEATGGRVTPSPTRAVCLDGYLFNIDNGLCVPEQERNVGVTAVFVAFTAVFVIMIGLFAFSLYRHSNLKVFKGASPIFLNLILVGTLIALGSCFATFSEVTEASCAVRQWFFHLGFALAFGSLYLKVQRISIIVNIKSSRILNLKDTQLLYKLGLMMLLMSIYLIIWTAVNAPVPEVFFNSDEYYYVCSDSWWSHALLIVELLLMLTGVYLAYRVRNAPAGFNEAKLVGFSVYNWLTLAVVLNIVRLTTTPTLDAKSALEALNVFLTSFVMVCVLFIPKIYMVVTGRGNEIQWSSNTVVPGPSNVVMHKSALAPTGTTTPESPRSFKMTGAQATSQATYVDATTVAGTAMGDELDDDDSSDKSSDRSSNRSSASTVTQLRAELEQLRAENQALRTRIQELDGGRAIQVCVQGSEVAATSTTDEGATRV